MQIPCGSKILLKSLDRTGRQKSDTLWVKKFIEIALSCPVSKINTFLCLTQKFKKGAKSGGKMYFAKCRQWTLQIVKNFIEITLSCSVSDINGFICLTQKFKMTAKSGRKTIFWKIASRLRRYPAGQKLC